MANFNYQAVANTVADNRTNAGYAASLGTAINAALAYYQRQKLNDQANLIQAVSNAPKAQVVTDANGNPIIDDTGATDRSDEAAYNADLGYNFSPGQIPDTGGVAGLQLANQMKAAQVGQQLRQAQIAASLQRAARSNATMPGADGLTPAQRMRQMNFQTVQDRINASGAQHQQNWQQRQDYLQGTYGGRGTRAAVDPAKEFDGWLKTNAGIGLSEWQNLQGSHIVNADGQGDPNGIAMNASTPDGKAVTIPTPVYNLALQKYQGVLAARNAPVPSSSATADPNALPSGSSDPTTGALFGQPGGAGATTAGQMVSTGNGPDDQAAAWAYSNPNDPRAAQILQRLGLQ